MMRRLLLGLLLVICCQGAWAAVDPIRLATAKEMVLKLGLAQAAQNAIQGEFRKLAGEDLNSPNLAWLRPALEVDVIATRMAPVYAEFLTTAQCRDLINFVTHAPGDRFWRSYALTQDKKDVPAPTFSVMEKIVLNTFVRSESWLALSRNRSGIEKNLGPVWKKLGTDAMASRMRYLIQRIQKDGASAIAPEDMLGRGLALILTMSRRMETSTQAYANRMDAVSIRGAFTPEALMDTKRRAETDAKLGQFAQMVADIHRVRIQEIDELVFGLRELPRSSVLNAKILSGMESRLHAVYANHLHWVEVEWRLLGTMRQILDFIGRNQSQIELRQGQLIFENPADLRQFQTFQRRFAAERQEEEAIERDMQEQSKTSNQLLGLE